MIAATVVVLTCAACGSDDGDPGDHRGRDTTGPLVPGRDARDVRVVDCAHVIAELPAPSDGFTTHAGDVALSTDRRLPTSSSGDEGPGRKLFAKAGLEVRAGADVEIRVEGDAAIGWGSPALPARVIHGPRCAPDTAGVSWVVVPGGFWVDEPRCVTLVVRSRGEEARARVPVGADC